MQELPGLHPWSACTPCLHIRADLFRGCQNRGGEQLRKLDEVYIGQLSP